MLAALDGFVRGGGGLLVAGGTQSFGPGGYAHSRLEPLLPVRLDVPEVEEEPALALALVIDRSGSMTGPKLELTKQAARATADAMAASDQIAVVVFDNQATPVVPLQAAANRQRITRDIGRIAAGGGTNILSGLARGGRRAAAGARAQEARDPAVRRTVAVRRDPRPDRRRDRRAHHHLGHRRGRRRGSDDAEDDRGAGRRALLSDARPGQHPAHLLARDLGPGRPIRRRAADPPARRKAHRRAGRDGHRDRAAAGRLRRHAAARAGRDRAGGPRRRAAAGAVAGGPRAGGGVDQRPRRALGRGVGAVERIREAMGTARARRHAPPPAEPLRHPRRARGGFRSPDRRRDRPGRSVPAGAAGPGERRRDRR